MNQSITNRLYRAIHRVPQEKRRTNPWYETIVHHHPPSNKKKYPLTMSM